MPNLKRLVDGGSSGTIRALQPQFNPLLWTSVATGHRADRHGVLHILMPDPAGGVRPLSRLDRKCRALWNIVGEHGKRNILVNWPLTFPAESIKGSCVSDLFFRLAGSAKGLEPPAPGASYPAELADEIQDLRFSPNELTLEEMAFFASDVESAEAQNDPLLARLAISIAETITTQAVAVKQIQKEEWDLAMVRYDILEALGPEFAACYPPQLSYIPDPVFKRYQRTIPSVCRYLDLMLGVLMELAGEDVLLILMSERGIHSDNLRPQNSEVAFRQAGREPWFREQGILAMHGPGVTVGGRIQGAGLLDLAPTMLRYMDIPVSSDMPGRVLREAFTTLPEEQTDNSPEVPIGGQMHAGHTHLSKVQKQLALNRWQEIGLLDTTDPDAAETVSKARLERDFNRAMVAVDSRRLHTARKLLEGLYQERPDDNRIALHLVRCRRITGDLEGARELLEELVTRPGRRPFEQMQLAQLHLIAGEHDKALLCLFRAEQAQAERPWVHCQIGQVYLDMQRLDDAERAFGKALERDADHAQSHRGMAAVLLQKKHYEEAIDTALRAIELDRNQPQAHYYLGAAMLAENRPDIAAQAFQTCLELAPNHVRALRGLAQICQMNGDNDAAMAYRKRAQQFESAILLETQLLAFRP